MFIGKKYKNTAKCQRSNLERFETLFYSIRYLVSKAVIETSSANLLSCYTILTKFGKSFINSKNMSGPVEDPWGSSRETLILFKVCFLDFNIILIFIISNNMYNLHTKFILHLIPQIFSVINFINSNNKYIL